MLKNPKDIFLLASVFLTGLSVLVIEILATRILSPYYGNTIYTTSSVIGVVLAALSIGYYFGGKLADKYPSRTVFYQIIFASGILVTLIHVLDVLILPWLNPLFSIALGPLIASLLIFFIPAFFLGILSPFAVKLHQSGTGILGQKTGEVFFWSTAGSIAGSLLSGFVLIPLFGIDTIIICTGIILSILGLFGSFVFKSNNKILIAMVILFGFGLLIASINLAPPNNVLYQKDGLYEKIKIVDGVWGNLPTRFLFQDRSYSAAMYLDSDELVYDYTKYYALYQLIKPEAQNALVIGGGAYSIPKALLQDSKTMQVDVAEIEPELYTLAQTYFNVKPSERLTNYIKDGRQLLALNPKKYDLIVSDVYFSFFSIPTQFTTEEFFRLAQSRLSENGVFVGNFAGNLNPTSPNFILSEIKTFKQTFPNSYFFAINSPNSSASQNIIFLGINGDKKLDVTAGEVVDSTNPIIKTLGQKIINTNNFDFSKHPILTDNFAPVEYMVGKIIY